MPHPAIRIAKKSDCIEISKLVHAIFPKAHPSFSPNDTFFASELPGFGLVGFAHMRIFKSSVLLQGIGVLPQFRRGGLGKSLISYVIKWCEKNHPGQPLKLRVKSANLPALSLYLKEGFMLTKDYGKSYRLTKARPN